MRLGRKGVLQDISFSVIFVFVFIIFLAFTSLIWYHLNAQVQSLDEDIVDSSAKANIDSLGNIYSFIDKIIPLIFILLWIVTMFLSIRIAPDHPIFYMLSLIFLFIFTFVSIVLVDFSTELFNNSVFDVVKDNLSNSLFFAQNLHYISFFVMIISLVIFYSKTKNNNEVGII